MKKKRKTLLYGLVSLLIGGLALSVGITYGLYITKVKGDQVFNSTAGKRKKTMFLECAMWNTYGNEKYYAGVFKASNMPNASTPGSDVKYILPSTNTTLTLTGEMTGSKKLYVFEFDTTKYDRIFFLRVGANITLDTTSYNTVKDSAWGYTEFVTHPESCNFFNVYQVKSGEEYYSHWWQMSTTYNITNPF